jgi:hypothetical protein
MVTTLKRRLSQIVADKKKKRLANIQQSTSLAFDTIPTDWVEFCSLLTIQSGNKYVPFIPYDFQIDLYNAIRDNAVTLVVKSRQMGFSQVVLSIILHKAILNPAYKALILSKNGNDTSLLAKRMREMILCLRERNLIAMDNDNLQHLSIMGGGKIYLLNSKPSAGRGIDSVSDILYDEAAFVEEIEATFSANDACQAMVGEEARTIVLSTPNGASGWYFDKFVGDNGHRNGLEILQRVREGELAPVQQWVDDAGWCKFVAHWKAHPLYSQNKNYLIDIANRKKMPLSAVKQEYDLSFTDSAQMVFSSILVRGCCTLSELTKKRLLDFDYYLSIDTAYSGDDYVVATVFKHDYHNNKYEMIELYRKRHETTDYHILKMSELIDKYQPLITGIEVTGGVGQVYLETLQKMFPQKTFQSIRTTGDSKPVMINKLILLMEKQKILLWNNSIVTKEFLSFQRKDGKMEAITGSHDDIVMSCAFQSVILPEYDINERVGLKNIRMVA